MVDLFSSMCACGNRAVRSLRLALRPLIPPLLIIGGMALSCYSAETVFSLMSKTGGAEKPEWASGYTNRQAKLTCLIGT